MKKKFHSFLNLKIICLFYDALSFISLGENESLHTSNKKHKSHCN